MSDDLIDEFRTEAGEWLEDLEEAVMSLETDPADGELVARIFRALHTIKGLAGMVGLDAAAAAVHRIEHGVERLRDGDEAIGPAVIRRLLAARDLVARLATGGIAGPDDEGLLADFDALAAGTSPADHDGASTAPPASVTTLPIPALAARPLHRIRYRPPPGAFAAERQPAAVLAHLRALGPNLILASAGALPDWQELDPTRCHLAWDVLVAAELGEEQRTELFALVNEDSELRIAGLGEVELPVDERLDALARMLDERGVASLDLDDAELLELWEGTAATAENRPASAPDVEPASRARPPANAGGGSLRVAGERVDRLVDLVGELVIGQARLERYAAQLGDGELDAIGESLAYLVAELRDTAMSIRMLPIGSLFKRYRRLVRDLAGDLGKPTRLVCSGEATELDKGVIDRLADPLLHLLRNSLDHGIEDGARRRAAGKDETATVHLAAEHQGAHVVVTISDDGGGLDTDVIRERAVERGLIAADAGLDDHAVHQLIFEPGFSTAAAVSELSGRGVGMDVVRTTIEELGGSIELHSERGRGTRVVLKLPLTLAIVDGLQVRCADEHYILPLASVHTCLDHRAIERVGERALFRLDDELVSLVSLHRLFALPAPLAEDRARVVVVGHGTQRLGIAVDEVVGQYQTVIRSLGPAYEGVREIAGATILGDGSVALILDLAGLHAAAATEERHQRQRAG